eukprot:7428203-Karenia_brevis.AAC.1
MKVVSRRKRRFERQRENSQVNIRSNFASKSTCHCEDKHCKQVKCIQPVEKEDPQKMILDFQVAEVSKALLAVKRIVEKGSRVIFGPGDEDNLILNSKAGDKVMLIPNGRGSYVVKVNFVGGGPTEITVDSGAEESVCPWEWG